MRRDRPWTRQRVSLLVMALLLGTAAGVFAQPSPTPKTEKEMPALEAPSGIPIVCDADLLNTDFVCGNGLGPFTTPSGSINNPDDFEYYRGTCTPGDPVVIEIFRTTMDMDPAAHACAGDLCGTSNAGWGAFMCPGGSALLDTGDDDLGIPCGVGGNFADPRLDFICPPEGVFTLAVYDFLGAGPNPEFEIHSSGVIDPAPTTPPVGLALLALLLLASGAFVLARRRSAAS